MPVRSQTRKDDMARLHVFCLGGNAPGANIEVHDIQFVACDTPEDAFPHLIERWYGDKSSLHLDGYTILEWADGHDVVLKDTPADGALRLFFINLGGYIAEDLYEAHRFGFFVAQNAEEAKAKAKATLLTDVFKQHTDNKVLVDDVLMVSELQGRHVHLAPNPDGEPGGITWQGYRPIGSQPA